MFPILALVLALAGVSAVTGGPVSPPDDCVEVIRRVLGEVAAAHHDAAVRRKANADAELARTSCAGESGIAAAARRALGAIDDPAVRLLDGDHFERMIAEWSGAPVVGVGLTEVLSLDVDETTRRLTVITPVPGSPAAAAGLRAGDVVSKIDGVATDSLGLTRSMKRLRRDAGETIRLEILRHDRPRQVALEARSLPELDPVRAERRRLEGLDLLVLHLRQFTPGATDSVRAALDSNGDVDAIALDLRDNPGGFVDELVGVAGLLLDSGTEVARITGPEPDTLRTGDEGPATDLPIAVLVDESAASAAEALAAALGHHGRARLYGARTYGKGLAHAARPIAENAWVLMLPVGQLETPAGRTVLGEGIEPDVRTENPLTQAARSLARARGSRRPGDRSPRAGSGGS